MQTPNARDTIPYCLYRMCQKVLDDMLVAWNTGISLFRRTGKRWLWHSNAPTSFEPNDVTRSQQEILEPSQKIEIRFFFLYIDAFFLYDRCMKIDNWKIAIRENFIQHFKRISRLSMKVSWRNVVQSQESDERGKGKSQNEKDPLWTNEKPVIIKRIKNRW